MPIWSLLLFGPSLMCPTMLDLPYKIHSHYTLIFPYATSPWNYSQSIEIPLVASDKDQTWTSLDKRGKASVNKERPGVYPKLGVGSWVGTQPKLDQSLPWNLGTWEQRERESVPLSKEMFGADKIITVVNSSWFEVNFLLVMRDPVCLITIVYSLMNSLIHYEPSRVPAHIAGSQ